MHCEGTSCYRQESLGECVDKPECVVKNSWFSLEPECSGYSYYTQVDYDCQPAYYMCDREAVINNVFSGLVYSPNYPNSFRTESDRPCFLTLHLPKNHHVEIILDFFDILKTHKCIGDYLEIKDYREAEQESSKRHADLNETHRITDGGVSRRSKYRWHTVGTMCGKIESKFTLRARSDIINIKFRPLHAEHPYLSGVKDKAAKTGFKIYFQAVPPGAPEPVPAADESKKQVGNSAARNRPSTTTPLTKIEHTIEQQIPGAHGLFL